MEDHAHQVAAEAYEGCRVDERQADTTALLDRTFVARHSADAREKRVIPVQVMCECERASSTTTLANTPTQAQSNPDMKYVHTNAETQGDSQTYIQSSQKRNMLTLYYAWRTCSPATKARRCIAHAFIQTTKETIQDNRVRIKKYKSQLREAHV